MVLDRDLGGEKRRFNRFRVKGSFHVLLACGGANNSIFLTMLCEGKC